MTDRDHVDSVTGFHGIRNRARQVLVFLLPIWSDKHETARRGANNRAEVSHEHTREQERQMRGFRSDGHAQRFLSVHGQCNNLFRLGRHLLGAPNYRVLRLRAFQTWTQVTCAR